MKTAIVACAVCAACTTGEARTAINLSPVRTHAHSTMAPAPMAGTYDAIMAQRGEPLFTRHCASCHVARSGKSVASAVIPAASTDEPVVRDTALTQRQAYPITRLRALWRHPPYFRDGSAATLTDVVAHYNRELHLTLTSAQEVDLVEFLKSR